jgi:hypothetical protein
MCGPAPNACTKRSTLAISRLPKRSSQQTSTAIPWTRPAGQCHPGVAMVPRDVLRRPRRCRGHDRRGTHRRRSHNHERHPRPAATYHAGDLPSTRRAESRTVGPVLHAARRLARSSTHSRSAVARSIARPGRRMLEHAINEPGAVEAADHGHPPGDRGRFPGGSPASSAHTARSRPGSPLAAPAGARRTTPSTGGDRIRNGRASSGKPSQVHR